ncbi:MAG: S49 family peptidase [Woeseiaceae bacterium]
MKNETSFTPGCFARHVGPWAMEPMEFDARYRAYKDGSLPMVTDSSESVLAVFAARIAPSSEIIREPQTGWPLYELRTDGIAVIPLVGTLTKVDSKFGGTNTTRVRKALRTAIGSEHVRGVMFQVDSPGGTVAGTDDLARDVAAAAETKPVHAYVEDTGASAAYWIASQANRITANPTADIGSIGVFAVIEDTSGAYDEAGIVVHLITTGEFKGAFEDGTTVSGRQLDYAQGIVDGLNGHFVAAVSAGRGLSPEVVQGLADGKSHLAAAARELALIDGIGSFDDALLGIAEEIASLRSDLTVASDPGPGSWAACKRSRKWSLTSAEPTPTVESDETE